MGPLIVFPAASGQGKYHAANAVLGTAKCRGTILLNTEAPPIHVNVGQTSVHPIVCSKCVKAWQQ